MYLVSTHFMRHTVRFTIKLKVLEFPSENMQSKKIRKDNSNTIRLTGVFKTVDNSEFLIPLIQIDIIYNLYL